MTQASQMMMIKVWKIVYLSL